MKDDDKIVFIEDDRGRIIIENLVNITLKEVQEAFRGEAERVGLKTEQDVVTMIKEIRREKRSADAGHV